MVKIIDKEYLINIIKKRSSFLNKIFPLNLNDLDVSEVTDMSNLFEGNEIKNILIDKWDVSNVKNMLCMFANSKFNGDISKWDTNNVKDMSSMFQESEFNGNLSNWDTSNVKDMSYMFQESKFNGNLSNWDTSNVTDMSFMFCESKFNGNISNWNVSNVEFLLNIFKDSKFERYEDLTNWKPYNLKDNTIFYDEMKNKKIYWSNEYIDLKKEDIKNYIDLYWAKKEKELLIDQNKNLNNINLTNKKTKFKI